MSADVDLVRPIEGPNIVEPETVPIVFVDYFMHCGGFAGAVNLALGTIDHSRKKQGEELAHVVVASRLRMTPAFARELIQILQRSITDAERPLAPVGDQIAPSGLVN